MPRGGYVSVGLTPGGREALHALAALASGASERKVTMSAALAAAVVVLRHHRAELREALAGQ